MSVDRLTAPAFGQIEQIKLLEPLTVILDNNVLVHVVNSGTQELIKIEFIFPGGKWNEKKKLVAQTVCSMLTEGTKTRSASEIADLLDFYGAFTETEVSGDISSFIVYTLNKNLEPVLEIIKDLFMNATFPEQELAIYKQNHKQKLIVNNEKVDYIARKLFNQLTYGDHHPYGYFAEPDDYDALRREDLIEFYTKIYNPAFCKIIAAGLVSDVETKLLNHYLGFNDWKKSDEPIEKEFFIHSSKEKTAFFKKEGSIQSAIRIGKPLIRKTHPDYIPLQVVNTIFGGYFGSRLMANIREDKGYTYGIGSGIGSHLKEGYFVIATEVGVKVCDDAIKQIYIEIDRMKNETVSEEELSLVKNYMLGSFLRSIDGPFEMADKFKNIMLFDLGYDYYERFIQTVRNITPHQVQELANKYFHKNSFYEVVAGDR